MFNFVGYWYIFMLWYEILDPCIVREQAETVYKTGKLTASIVKLYKTRTYKNIDTQAWLYRIPMHQEYRDNRYFDTYRTSLRLMVWSKVNKCIEVSILAS